MKDFSDRNLQGMSFVNQDLRYSSFVNSDLRGADFTGANVSGVDFSLVKTGITPVTVAFIFMIALLISLGAGYVAMLGGLTVQKMLASDNDQVRMAGFMAIVIAILFILYTGWKGGGNAIRNVILPAILLGLFLSLTAYLSGFGTGMGMLYMVLAVLLLVIMFVAGTLARAVAGTVSNILFLIVAFSGGLFGKSLGGDISTVVLSLASAHISKKALSGADGFIFLRRVTIFITRKFGTSFRNARMVNARFFRAKVHNADFTNSDISLVNWGGATKTNCIVGDTIFTAK
jgi:uncharacterized protein YjbI with pentapeptide repeats